jgi:beta-lactam-binding protein with PASTA domain
MLLSCTEVCPFLEPLLFADTHLTFLHTKTPPYILITMKLRLRAVNRFFNLVLGALAMLVVALTSAFIAMRLAIHGREVAVPNLAGLTISEASKEANSLGLSLNIENRFYSTTTPPGHIIAQYPIPGVTVRRESAVRATESLGTQQVSTPDVLGQSERTASINLRRISLDLGTVAYMNAPGEAGIVLAQTPNPNASGVDRPRVSLLLSQPEAAGGSTPFLMPSLTGLTLMSAAARASSAGLRVVSAEELKVDTPTDAAPPTQAPTQSPATSAPANTTTAGASVPATPGASTATVVAQSPPSGYRVVKGDAVQITIAY